MPDYTREELLAEKRRRQQTQQGAGSFSREELLAEKQRRAAARPLNERAGGAINDFADKISPAGKAMPLQHRVGATVAEGVTRLIGDTVSDPLEVLVKSPLRAASRMPSNMGRDAMNLGRMAAAPFNDDTVKETGKEYLKGILGTGLDAAEASAIVPFAAPVGKGARAVSRGITNPVPGKVPALSPEMQFLQHRAKEEGVDLTEVLQSAPRSDADLFFQHAGLNQTAQGLGNRAGETRNIIGDAATGQVLAQPQRIRDTFRTTLNDPMSVAEIDDIVAAGERRSGPYYTLAMLADDNTGRLSKLMETPAYAKRSEKAAATLQDLNTKRPDFEEVAQRYQGADDPRLAYHGTQGAGFSQFDFGRAGSANGSMYGDGLYTKRDAAGTSLYHNGEGALLGTILPPQSQYYNKMLRTFGEQPDYVKNNINAGLRLSGRPEIPDSATYEDVAAAISREGRTTEDALRLLGIKGTTHYDDMDVTFAGDDVGEMVTLRDFRAEKTERERLQFEIRKLRNKRDVMSGADDDLLRELGMGDDLPNTRPASPEELQGIDDQIAALQERLRGPMSDQGPTPMQVWHQAQQDLGDDIGSAKKNARRNAASSYTQQRQEILGAMDQVSPSYAKARGIYRGAREIDDAKRLGQDIFSRKMLPDDWAKEAQSLAEMERKAATTGAYQSILDKLDVPDTYTPLKADLFKGSFRQKLGGLVGDEAAEKLVGNLDHERYLRDTANSARAEVNSKSIPAAQAISATEASALPPSRRIVAQAANMFSRHGFSPAGYAQEGQGKLARLLGAPDESVLKGAAEILAMPAKEGIAAVRSMSAQQLHKTSQELARLEAQGVTHPRLYELGRAVALAQLEMLKTARQTAPAIPAGIAAGQTNNR